MSPDVILVTFMCAFILLCVLSEIRRRGDREHDLRIFHEAFVTYREEAKYAYNTAASIVEDDCPEDDPNDEPSRA